MRHVSARTQPHSVTLHHIRSSSKIRFFFDFFAPPPRFPRTFAQPPQPNAPSHPPSHTSAKSLSGIVCRPISLSLNTGFGYAIAPNGAIRSAYRPISPYGLNTGFWSPYFALWAQYGFWSPYFAQWAQYGLWLRYCPEWGNTLRFFTRGCATLFHPGLRYATPRAVFWRPFRALAASPRPIYHICRRQMFIPPRMP